jgi:citrate synthase
VTGNRSARAKPAAMRSSGMIDGAAEAIVVTARTAGWLAHAFEEYDHGRLPRARAVCTGD